MGFGAGTSGVRFFLILTHSLRFDTLNSISVREGKLSVYFVELLEALSYFVTLTFSS